VRRAWPELDARITDLDAAQLERQVLGLGLNQPCSQDVEASQTVGRLANDLYAEANPRWSSQNRAGLDTAEMAGVLGGNARSVLRL
jgi:hypothetical protein